MTQSAPSTAVRRIVGDDVGDAELAHAAAHGRVDVGRDEGRGEMVRARAAQDRRADQADADDAEAFEDGGKGSVMAVIRGPRFPAR